MIPKANIPRTFVLARFLKNAAVKEFDPEVLHTRAVVEGDAMGHHAVARESPTRITDGRYKDEIESRNSAGRRDATSRYSCYRSCYLQVGVNSRASILAGDGRT